MIWVRRVILFKAGMLHYAAMSVYHAMYRKLCVATLGASLLLAGCVSDLTLRPVATPSDTASAAPSATPTPGDRTTDPTASSAPSGTSSTGATSDWQSGDQEMEVRTLQLPTGIGAVEATVVRFDPDAYRLRVRYEPDSPVFMGEWNQAVEPLAMINGGFFDEQDRATALVVFDGTARGTSYRGRGGMAAVNAEGEFEIRSLSQDSYDSDEELQQAVQSTPMLIQPGGELSDLDTSDDRSRRSVIAQDRQGRVLLIAVDLPFITLLELAEALHDSDLDLDRALALDGGRSTGLYVNSSATRVAIDSYDQVPLVLTVQPRTE